MNKLQTILEVRDRMTKNLTRPIDKLSKMLNRMRDIGNNQGLVNATNQAQELGEKVNRIRPGALSEMIEDGTVDEMGLMVQKANLLNGSLATQSILVQDLNKGYTEAVSLYGAQSDKALKLEKQLDRATIKENALGIEVVRSSKAIEDKINKQNKFNDKLKTSNNLANKLTTSIKKIGGAYLAFLSVRGMQRQFTNWLELANQRQAIEVPLQVTMTNMGATHAEIDSVKHKAMELQKVTTFSDDVFLAGASELATYLSTGEAVESMMETLADYASGMGGMNVDAKAMTDYATSLGKALEGNFEGLSRKGFMVSEVQKEILATGTEMERVAVINDIIAESWGGMAKALNNTPQGKIISLRQELSSMHETIGLKLQPAVMNIVDVFYSHLPQIETLLMGVGTLVAGGTNFFANVVFPLLFSGLTAVINLATGVYNVFANNWSVIEPIVWGIVSVMTAYAIVTTTLAVKTKILKVSTLALAKAKNILTASTMLLSKAKNILTASTMLLSKAKNILTVSTLALIKAKLKLAIVMIKPLIIIGLIIGVVHLAIQIFNKWAGTSLTVAGVIKGALFVLGAFIFNMFALLYNTFLTGVEVVWNTIATFAEFFANVFDDPIGSIKNLFLDLFNFILGGFEFIAKAFDKTLGKVAGTNFAGAVISAREDIKSLKSEPDITVSRFNADDHKLDVISYKDAFKAGHDFSLAGLFTLQGGAEDIFNPIMGGAFGEFENMLDTQNDILSDIAKNTGVTADNTGLMANEVNISDEDLKYFRDIAEKEAIYRYTSQTVSPEVNIYIDKVEKEVDIDRVIEEIEKSVEEDLFVSTEGVYA